MLRVQSISKSFGPDVVLHDVSFMLNTGERAGLVGPNGSGKSTLLQIIAGQLDADAGSVWMSPGATVAYLPQYAQDEMQLSVRQAMERGIPEMGETRVRLADVERALREARGDALDSLAIEYARAQETMERLGGYDFEARMHQVVRGLAIDLPDLDTPVGQLSGGNKTKLSLARLLLSGASVLLLDEPTNYLDLPALLWLERFVTTGNRSYLIVSHDRRFLDNTVSTILSLEPAHTLRRCVGNYSAYAAARQLEEEKHLAAYLDQQAEIKRIALDIRNTKDQARGVEAHTKSGAGADKRRRLAKKVARKAKVRERRLERQLGEGTRLEKPRQSWSLHLADLGANPIEDDRTIVEIAGLRAGYDGKVVLRGVDLLIRGRDRLALVGANGSGKSTLLRCITGEMPFAGECRLAPSVRPGMLKQETDSLPLDATALEIFRRSVAMHEDEARTYLHKFLFSGDEALKPVGALSYGQRAKLALAVLVLSGANFLVLDEPTSHLDMPAVESIERSLAGFVGPLLVVSHDRQFLDAIGVNRVAALEDGGLLAFDSVERYEASLLPESADRSPDAEFA